MSMPTPEEKSERAPATPPVVGSPGACLACGAALSGRRRDQRCCSGRCRAALSRRKREDRETRLRELVKVLAREAGLRAEDFA